MNLVVLLTNFKLDGACEKIWPIALNEQSAMDLLCFLRVSDVIGLFYHYFAATYDIESGGKSVISFFGSYVTAQKHSAYAVDADCCIFDAYAFNTAFTDFKGESAFFGSHYCITCYG